MSTATKDSVTVKFDPNAVNLQADIISGATDKSAGVMTAAQVQKLNKILPADTLVFVSPTGSDSNIGTSDQPVQTLRQALALLPAEWTGQAKVLLAPGSYTEALPLNINVGQPIGPDASPLAIIGDFTDVLGNLTNTVADPNAVVLTAGPLPPLVNAFVRVTSGANTGQRRMVANNTPGTIRVNAPFIFPLVGGETFIVETCAVQVNYDTVTVIGSGNTLGLKGIEWTSTNPASDGWTSDFGVLKLFVEACAWNLNGGAMELVHDCNIRLSSTSTPWDPDGVDNPFNTSLREEAGVFINGGFGFFAAADRCLFFAYLVVKDLLRVTAARSGAATPYLWSTNTSHIIDNYSLVTIANFSGNPAANTVLDGDLGFLPGLLNLFNSSTLIIDGCSIVNSANDAIYVESAKLVAGDVSGSTNAGYGIRTTQVSYTVVDSGAVPTLVTGTAGDLNFRVAADDHSYFGNPNGGAAPALVTDGNGVTGFNDNYLNRVESLANSVP